MADAPTIFFAWFDRQSWPVRTVVSLGLFALLSIFLLGLYAPFSFFTEGEYFAIFLILLGLIGAAVLTIVVIYGRLRQTRLDWLSLAIIYPVAVPLALALIGLVALIDDNVGQDVQFLAFGSTVVFFTIVFLALLWIPLRHVEGFDGSRSVTRELGLFTVGFSLVAVVAMVLTPTGLIEKTLPFYSVSGPIVAAFCAVVYFWHRRMPASFALWPIAAVIGLWAVNLLFSAEWVVDFAETIESHRFKTDQVSFLTATLIGAPLTLLAGAGWEAGRRLISDPEIRAWVMGRWLRFEATELYGGVIQKLDRRRQDFWPDALLWIASTIFLIVALLEEPESIEISELTTAGLYLVFLGVVLMLGLSLLMRLFAKQRFRWITVFGIPVVNSIVTAIIAAPIINILDIDRVGEQGLTILALLIVLPIPLMIAQSRIDLDRRRLGMALLVLGGYVIADMVFSTLLGSTAANRFTVGLRIGSIGALVTGIVLAGVFLFYRNVSGIFLVWPIGAAFSALLLRILITVQGSLNDAAETITIQTGLGEVVLAALFGAFCGYLAVLAKRIWYDQDPAARRDAVRMRGFVLILHGIAPILILLFVIAGLNSFFDRAQIDADTISRNAQRLSESVVRIGDEVRVTVVVLNQQADLLVRQAQEATSDLGDLTGRIGDTLLKIGDEVAQGAVNVGSAAIADAKAEGARLAQKVGEHLDDAISLPPIDLGLFEIEWPDLGIGDAIKDMMGNLLSSLVPDLNIETVFQDLLARSLANIKSEFNAPIQRAEAMRVEVLQFAEDNVDKLDQRFVAVTAEAERLATNAEQEFKTAQLHFEQVVINVVALLYNLMVLLVVLLTATVLFLVWKAINGIFVMVERVGRGWQMMVHERDTPPDADEAGAMPA